ncbi:hypothetical protein HY492_00320, partial [Candidatus Woesearchaeota archaeon]|nr:hypothetical protein [Candidatus Woesearchaeota archaeon]
MKKGNKRGFFIFEPVIVLVFLGALLSASFISLAKYDFLQKPISSHADTLVGTYLASETDVFLFRELRARYVVEDVIYQFAGSGGLGTDKSGCWVQGGTQRQPPERLSAQSIAPDIAKFTEALALEFSRDQLSMKTQGFQTEVIPYEFVVQDPLMVVGIPLQPESIPIKIPHDVRTTGVGRFAEYPARVSFTLSYSYKLQETYDELANGIAALQSCVNAQTEAGRADCIEQKIKTFNTERLHWSLTHEKDTSVYDLDIEHQYQAPLCLNKPLTLLRMTFPA